MPSPTSSSSARTAGRRSARTSPSARTAARGCASGRRRSSATAAPLREPRPARRAPRAHEEREARPAPRAACGRARSPASAPTRLTPPVGDDRCSSRCRSGCTSLLAFVADSATSRSPALDGDPWRFVTAPFLNDERRGRSSRRWSASRVFGWLLERRHGPLVVLLVFALCGVGGDRASRSRSMPTRSWSSAPTAPRSGCSPPGPSRSCWRRRRDRATTKADLLGAARHRGVVLAAHPGRGRPRHARRRVRPGDRRGLWRALLLAASSRA